MGKSLILNAADFSQNGWREYAYGCIFDGLTNINPTSTYCYANNSEILGQTVYGIRVNVSVIGLITIRLGNYATKIYTDLQTINPTITGVQDFILDTPIIVNNVNIAIGIMKSTDGGRIAVEGTRKSNMPYMMLNLNAQYSSSLQLDFLI